MAERSAEDLLDWAFGYLCNAVPMIEYAANDGFSYESEQWLYGWEAHFKPAFHAWLDRRAELDTTVKTAPQRESLPLEALVLMIKRAITVSESLGEPVVPVLLDTLRDIYEELSRLQDLER